VKQSGIYVFIFASLLLVLALFFSIRLFNGTLFFQEPDYVKKTFVPKAKDEQTWLMFMQDHNVSHSFYPVKEIELSWDLVDPQQKKEQLYKLSFDYLDSYQYFCLIQVLKQHKLNRTIEKLGNGYLVFLDLHSFASADTLLKELKYYDIDGVITPYMSNVQYKER
jgi:hypothetical protein